MNTMMEKFKSDLLQRIEVVEAEIQKHRLVLKPHDLAWHRDMLSIAEAALEELTEVYDKLSSN